MKAFPTKTSTRLSIAAIALLAGVSVAAAADNGMAKSESTMPKASSHMSQSKSAASAKMANDRLTLSSSQRKDAWQDINKLAAKETAPANFTAKVGAKLPSSLTAHPIPVTTANKVPALRPYQYAMLKGNKLLIVNPNDKTVAEVITR